MSSRDMDVAFKTEVRDSIRNGADLSIPYLAMNILAATIASYGLLANSPAVIIGAMLIAMLLGPITGISLALVESDLQLLLKGLLTLLAGAAVVFATAYAIGILHVDAPVSGEIIGRTSPNLADLVIALAGGAAGAYATVSPRLSVAVVGVAISTALVPPLCAANILFAKGEFSLGAGALLLTFTNIVAIQFSSSVVFWLSGFRRISRAKGLSFLGFVKSNLVSIVILLFLAVTLTQKVEEIIARRVFETKTEAILKSRIVSSSSFVILPARINEADPAVCEISVGMVAPAPPTAEQVAALEKELPPHPNGKKVRLRLRYAETVLMTSQGRQFSGSGFELQQ